MTILRFVFALSVTIAGLVLSVASAGLLPRTTGVVLLLLGVTASVLYMVERHRETSRRRTPSKLVPPPKFDHLPEIAKSVAETSIAGGVFQVGGRTISSASLFVFNALLTSPRPFHGRIVEEITPGRTQVRQKISASLLLDAPRFAAVTGNASATPTPLAISEATLLYPATIVRKGEMQDNFHVAIKGEERVVTLTFEEYCQTMVVSIRSIEAAITPHYPTVHHADLNWCVERALALICGRGIESDDYSEYRTSAKDLNKKINDLLKKGDVAAIDKPYRDQLVAIGEITISLCWRYPVVIVIPHDARAGSRAVVRYEREYTAKWYQKPTPLRWLRNGRKRLEAIFGARPGEIEVDIRRAAQAQSYHLIVNGSSDAFLGSQRISGLDNYRMLDHGRLHYRFRMPLGQSYVHGYFRDAVRRDGSPETLLLRANFFETPPASVAKAALASFAAFTLIWTVAIVSAGEGTPTSDFSALILAFPAISAAFVGFERPGSDSILGSEIVARLCSLATFFLCLSAASLYMAQTRGLLEFPLAAEPIAGIDNVSWLTLTAAALAIALWATLTWVNRSLQYFAVIGQSGRMQDDHLPRDVEYELEVFDH